MTGSGRDRAVPAGFFSLRTPLLPFDELVSFTDGLSAEASADDPVRLAEALAADRRLLRRRLDELFSRPAAREALFLASPDLHDALPAWKEDPEGPRGRRVERALVKYLSRMTSRPTPFGLFAGSATGSVGSETRFVLGGSDAATRHSRLDVDYLFALAEAITRDAGARDGFVYRPNSSLYLCGDRWRYVEGSTGEGGRSYALVAVEDSTALRDTLARAETGASIAALAAAIVDEETSLEEATAFVVDLVDAQVLVPDAGLRITGPEPARVMGALLAGRSETAEAAAALVRAVDALESIDEGGEGADPERYRAIAAGLPHLLSRPNLSRLFQVDVVTAADATLGGAVLEEIERAVAIARRLLPRARPELEAFREAFLERYGEREVPLVEALDEESGIGFPAWAGERSATEPLLADLAFPPPREMEKVRWRARERLLLRLLQGAWSRGETEIVLDAADLEELAARDPLPLPGAFAVVAAVSASSDEALAKGDFRIVLTGLDGPAGACLLGRFCHSDPQLLRLVEGHLREEEALQPEAVFAEVIHLPEGRAGNVLLRPVLREYEIPFLGASGAPQERQLSVSDLLVSVSGDDVVLRSRRLGQRVVPRITAAHDYTRNALGIYRFLGEIQTRDVAIGRPFSWGPFDGAPFLPRVSTGRIVLTPASWNVPASELSGLERLGDAARFAAIREWRERRMLPRRVLFVVDDNELVVDFEAVLSVDAFLHASKGRDSVVLTEMLLGPGTLCVRGPGGRYVHELVVPFVRRGEAPEPAKLTAGVPEHAATRAAAERPANQVATASASIRRSFPPASEWMTAKVYVGVVAADRLLRETLGPFVREALSRGTADRWFFLRYADPRPHLRLRLHGDPLRLHGELLPALASALRSSPLAELVWKLQLDTYEREVERYGGPEAIETIEGAFFADSDAVLDLLELLEEGEGGGEERWRIALRGADALLDDFGLDLAGKRRLVESVRRELGVEVGSDAAFGRALGARYRSLSRELERVLHPDDEAGNPLAPGFDVLRARSRRLAPAAAELRRLEAGGRLAAGLPSIAASLVHMHLNRLLRSAQRQQELVICDLLSRLYASRQVRGR